MHVNDDGIPPRDAELPNCGGCGCPLAATAVCGVALGVEWARDARAISCGECGHVPDLSDVEREELLLHARCTVDY